jgi:6-phosphogluconate dehydrogenase
MVRRLVAGGHRCVVFDRSPDTVNELVQEGAAGARSLADLVKNLGKPRALWLMVPAAAVEATIGDLMPHLEAEDILIDGGNSFYVDDIRRSNELATKGVHYVDVGTRGGAWGLERGYCKMIGGEKAVVEHLDPILSTRAPGAGDVARTPGRERLSGTSERGYLRCGLNGAGHFVKMVHNGIEYGSGRRSGCARGAATSARTARDKAGQPDRRRWRRSSGAARVIGAVPGHRPRSTVCRTIAPAGESTRRSRWVRTSQATH